MPNVPRTLNVEKNKKNTNFLERNELYHHTTLLIFLLYRFRVSILSWIFSIYNTISQIQIIDFCAMVLFSNICVNLQI